MTPIALKDILINARQESFRMQHYYLGVEHYFVGLLEVHGGLARTAIEAQGFTSEYIIDAVRRHTGKGTRQRLWAGMPTTPRAEVVLGIANDFALENGHDEINERDLLTAILEEGESIPLRVLRKLDFNLSRFRQDLLMQTPAAFGSQPNYVQIEFSPAFDPDQALSEQQLFILRRMFHGYNRVRIERKLTGGFTAALILVVTPIQGDSFEDAAVVVKIDQADSILDEAQRYEAGVKNSLPPLTARLEDKPTTAETSDLAGLKYTFIAGVNDSAADLRVVASDFGGEALGRWLRESLFPYFGKTWWQQRRPFRFQAWSEYDWALPPLLTLDFVGEDEPPADCHVIKDPVRRAKVSALEYGQVVAVENFHVHKVDKDNGVLYLTIGKGADVARRAYKIGVRGIDLGQHVHYRGEVIERMVGRVWTTRQETLFNAASALEPDFDSRALTIPGPLVNVRLLNPLTAYNDLLDREISGTLCKIHGDLHLGNILVGPNQNPFLIDFAQARSGHTLFDWASLEISLLSEVVMPAAGEDWTAARAVAGAVAALNQRLPLPVMSPALDQALLPLAALRSVVAECLAEPERWSEYFTALVFCGLRALDWGTMPIAGRRIALLSAALALNELRARPTSTGTFDTMPNDLTDLDVLRGKPGDL